MVKAFVKGTVAGIALEIAIFVGVYLMNPQSFRPLSEVALGDIANLAFALFLLAAVAGGGLGVYIRSVGKTP